MNKVKQSAKNLEIPDSLEPETIKKKLKEAPSPKWYHKYERFSAVTAATALIAFFVLGGVLHIPGLDNKQDNQKSTEATSTASAADSSRESSFPGADSYQTIYQTLKKMNTAGPLDKINGALGGGALDSASKEAADESLSSGSAESASEDYSSTNLQELGVDEGDTVKCDGQYLYILKSDGTIQIADTRQDTIKIAGTIHPENLQEIPREMYVEGAVLTLIATGSHTAMENQKEDLYELVTDNYTTLYTYDISDRTNPKLKGSVSQQGSYSASRKKHSIIYLFTQYSPKLTSAAKTEDYVPAVNGTQLKESDICLPEYAAVPNYLVISSVDSNSPSEPLDSKGIISAAENFYVSTDNIYISTTNPNADGSLTQIMKFHYDKGRISAVYANGLRGYLNDSFSMNEYDGYLRIVLTDNSQTQETNALYILDEKLNISGTIQDIARGETIQSARFMGDTGYFVTYKNTDPLFSVDLSNPSSPKILGALKVTGFSSYLHFYGEDRLLGVGYETDPKTGASYGIKLSMFDISDPANVEEVQKYVIKDANDCSLLNNYKAVMIDPQKNVIGFSCDNKYLIFTYHDKKGFQNVFAETLSETTEAYYSSLYTTTISDYILPIYPKGCFIKDTFYLIWDNELRSYDMSEGYKAKEKLSL
ncbi:beta-propeller domain-containing protein [Brotonthovivens ammoniilytica]|uniref:Beta-propeller domain-containing protein n=1 Tax=Brotonthovivens ammoniilytica TaxID=2981725 RepID=A0ABT2TMV8_9FIRM|nr:beta-propeller domain-containing protein [Brotonthovivens ammoniilytica]MCU6763506.1 beta-propeller domain-containing protein [Brotonthovivens ammoniilytica]